MHGSVRPAGLQPALAERGTSGIVSEREPDPRGVPQRSRGEGACRVDIVDNARCDLAQYTVVQPPRDEILDRETQVGRLRRRSRGGQTLNGRSRHPRLGGCAGQHRVKPRQGSAEVVSDPEVWLASRACSFVVCARAAGHDSIDSVEVHAALLAEPGSDWSSSGSISISTYCGIRPTTQSRSRTSKTSFAAGTRCSTPTSSCEKPGTPSAKHSPASTARNGPSTEPSKPTSETPTTRQPIHRRERCEAASATSMLLHERDRPYAHTDKKGLRLPPRWAEPWRRRSPG